MKKFMAVAPRFLTMVLVALACVLPANIAAAKALFASKAKYAILIDAETNTVLYSKKADKLMAPASMSKLMTAAILFRELKAGKLKLEGTFKVSEHAWRTGGGPSGTAAMFAPLRQKNSDLRFIAGDCHSIRK